MLNFIVCNINLSMYVVHETFQSNGNDLSDGLFFAPSVQNKSRRKRSWLCVLSTTLNWFSPNAMLGSTSDTVRQKEFWFTSD